MEFNIVKLVLERKVRDMPNPTYAKLKGRIVEKYNSQQCFAAHMGLSKQSVNRKLKCKSGFSQKDIERWATELNIEPEDYGTYFFT